jgi:hypothetical protein
MDEEILYVPVPRSRLDAVLRAAATPAAVVEPPTEQPEPTQPAATIDEVWTREQLERLRRELRNPVVRTVLDLCAAQPDQEVSIRVVEEEAGVQMPKVRASMAGLTMFLEHRFGTRVWPLDWSWRNGAASYLMPAQLAAWWKGKK